MKLIMVPSGLTEQELVWINESLDDIEKHPETKNDYCLVDVIGDEINIKVFVGAEVEKVCEEYECTPRDYLMDMMRHQNGVKYES
jgi:hypothetical protein